MQKHLEEALTTSGLTPDQVKALVDLPEDAKDYKIEDHVAPIRTGIETALKNDPKFYEGLNADNLPKEFVKKLETEQYGRAANIVRTNMLKATGLSEKDFEALGADGKKIEVFTPAFVKKLSEGKVTDAELQSKLLEANAKIEELEGKIPGLETGFKEKYEGQAASDKFDFIVLAQIAGLKTKVPAHYVADKIAATLKSAYGFDINGTTATLMQKDKPTLKAMTSDGKKELTLTDAITSMLEKDGLLEKGNVKKEDGKDEIDVSGDDKGLQLSGHVNDKIKQRLKEEKSS